MPVPISLSRSVEIAERVRRIHRLVRRVPPGLRRPDTAVRLALAASCLWFAVLFAALARVDGAPLLATSAFAVAAVTGTAGALGAALERHQLSATLLAVTLATGQMTALVQQL